MRADGNSTRACTPARRPVRTALDTELARRAIEVERLAGAELDELVARRLARVDAELRELAPGGA